VKKCPACGYANSGDASCGVCGRDISSVSPLPEVRAKKDRAMPLLAAVLLLCCLAAFFVTGGPGRGNSAREGENFSDEASFGYEGVIYSLDRMAELKFLPQEDRLRTLPLLNSRDERVACAAVRAAGRWARSGARDAAVFVEALRAAAKTGPEACRALAAAELPAAPAAEKTR
jgi:hypothetical protein